MVLPVSRKTKDGPSTVRRVDQVDQQIFAALAATYRSSHDVGRDFSDAVRSVMESYRRGAVSDEQAKAIISALVAGYSASMLSHKIEVFLSRHLDTLLPGIGTREFRVESGHGRRQERRFSIEQGP